MDSLRHHVRTHISRELIAGSLALSFVALFITGKIFVSLVGNTLADMDAESAPYFRPTPASIRLAMAHLNSPAPQDMPARSFASGEDSPDVLALQKFLVWKELLPVDAATGYFGSTTLEAVMRYQTLHHLPANGMVGPLTRAAWSQDIQKVNKRIAEPALIP